MDDEVYSGFEAGLLVAKLIDNRIIILLKRTFKNLFDVSFLPNLKALIQALFNHITRKFKLTESDEIFCNFGENALVFVCIVQFDDVLYKVIAVGVFDETAHILDNILSQLQFLLLCTFFQASLHHTAAMLVLSNVDAVVHASVKNELRILTSQLTSSDVVICWAF